MLPWISRVRSLWRNKKNLHLAAFAAVAMVVGFLSRRTEPLYAEVAWGGFLFSQWLFVGISNLALFLGGLLRRSRERYLVWSKKGFRNSRLAFTILLWFTVSLCFLMGFRIMHNLSLGQLAGLRKFLHYPSTQWWNLGAWTFLLLPDLLDLAFSLWENIPERIWKTWVYVLNRDLPPREGQRWTAFSFSTKRTPEKSVYLRATNRYPAQWKLGECFQFFLNIYNRHHPRDPIRYISDDDYERPHRWIFYIRTFWGKRRLDPDLSLFENRINENTIVIAERVTEYLEVSGPPILIESITQTTYEDLTSSTTSVGQLG